MYIPYKFRLLKFYPAMDKTIPAAVILLWLSCLISAENALVPRKKVPPRMHATPKVWSLFTASRTIDGGGLTNSTRTYYGVTQRAPCIELCSKVVRNEQTQGSR